MPDTRFLTGVVLHDYKSIRYCDLSLPQFAVLVGPNGAGKSNFLDALQFVAEALFESLDYALINRGGAARVVRRSVDPLSEFGVRIDCARANASATYAFKVRAESDGSYEVVREDCKVVSRGAVEGQVHYSIQRGESLHLARRIRHLRAVTDFTCAKPLTSLNSTRCTNRSRERVSTASAQKPSEIRSRPIQPNS